MMSYGGTLLMSFPLDLVLYYDGSDVFDILIPPTTYERANPQFFLTVTFLLYSR